VVEELVRIGGFKVIYGDTDSLFVSSTCVDPIDARRRAGDLAASLNGDLARYIASRCAGRAVSSSNSRSSIRAVPARARQQHPRASKRYAGW